MPKTLNNRASNDNGKPILISSEQLFRQQNRIDILHRGETYRLQITRQGKLILTK